MAAVTMPAYGAVLIDIDMGLGRQYGYRHPARHGQRLALDNALLDLALLGTAELAKIQAAALAE